MPSEKVRNVVDEPYSQLRNIKKELKEWEHAFANGNGRKPNKSDIAADKEIARRYKLYAKLKTQMEENPSGNAEEANGQTEQDLEKTENSKRSRKNKSQSKPEEQDVAAPSLEPSSIAKPPNTQVPRPPLSARRQIPSELKTKEDEKSIRKENIQEPSSVEKLTTIPSTPIRPFGNSHDLPQNFKLKKSTIASGPILSDGMTPPPRRSMNNEANFVGDQAVSSLQSNHVNISNVFKPTIITQASVNSPTQDIMNRKKQIENITNSRPSSTSSNNPNKNNTTTSNTISTIPNITQIRVVSGTVEENDKGDVEQPITKPDYAALSKPYDPTSQSEKLDKPETIVTESENEVSSDKEKRLKNLPILCDDSPSITVLDEQKKSSSIPTTPESNKATDDSIINSPVFSTPTTTINSKPTDNVVPTPEQTSATVIDEDDKEDIKNAIAPIQSETLSGEENVSEMNPQPSTKPNLILQPKYFRRLSPDGVLRCRLYRKKAILGKAHPTFFLYNEADDRFLLAARKTMSSKYVNFVISSSQSEISKDSPHYVAKLKANFQRTTFVLSDARSHKKTAENKGLREMACISYSKTVLPREIEVAIPALSISFEDPLQTSPTSARSPSTGSRRPSTATTRTRRNSVLAALGNISGLVSNSISKSTGFSTNSQTPQKDEPKSSSSSISSNSSGENNNGSGGFGSNDILHDVQTRNTEKLMFLRNKAPRWNESTQSHCLNFGGRVTQPSIKNFQLIANGDDSYIVMQFGRCGPDYFTLDAKAPLTPVEAFAIALTTFDAYDSA
ncbi:hypothetical protein HK098_000344 [Nowakowskiella sp. JEL0407]|nr:hypothetical protein HK098_000344 [Nowakowskiella sp. JEL0407]